MNGFYLSPDRKELKWWGNEIPFYNSSGFIHSEKKGQLDFILGGNYYYDSGYRTDNFEKRYKLNTGLRYRNKKIQGLSYGLHSSYMSIDKIDFLMWKNAAGGAYIHDEGSVSPTKGYRLTIDPFVSFYQGNSTRHSLKSRFYRVVNNIDGNDLDNRGDQYFVEYQYHKKFHANSAITVGASMLEARTQANLYGDHTGSNYAIFGQFDTRFFDRISLSIGARWENFRLDNDKNSSKPLFRSGVNYQIAKHTFVRASFGQGYRFPTIAEKYTYTNLSGLQILPNPALKPESGWSAETGIKQGVQISGWKGYVDVAAFITEYTDMMEFSFGRFDTVTFTPVYLISEYNSSQVSGFQSMNVGQARISGLEVSLNGNGAIGMFDVQLLAGYNYMIPVDLNSDSIYRSTKTTNDDFLKYRFSHSAKSDLEIGFRKLSLGFSYLYVSHVNNIDKYFEIGFIMPGLKAYREEHNKGYHLFNFRLNYKPSESYNLGIHLKNAFNKEYMIRPGDIAAPRTIVVQAGMKF